MTLTALEVSGAKPGLRPAKLFDGGGLFLLVNPNGSRLWRLKYRIDGREKLLALGAYPDVSLRRAREKRDDARRLIADGIDPGDQRQNEKAARGNTFEVVAREWLAIQKKKLASTTYEKAVWTLETLVFPYLGARPIDKILAADVLKVLRRIEERGIHETAHRTRQRCSQVFRYAVVTERATNDVTINLRGALVPVVTKHHAAITEPAKIGELLRALHGYQGHQVTQFALKLVPLLFVRPGELRHAEWSEFELDGDDPQWRLPAAKVKMKDQHIVPLSMQAITLLRELHFLTGNGRYVFPSGRTSTRPMSEAAVTAALRRMGYASNEMTWHGFRSLASTCLNEQGFNTDWIELQLSHKERNKIRGSYNFSLRVPERRKMMQWWADYLDSLRNNTTMLPFG